MLTSQLFVRNKIKNKVAAYFMPLLDLLHEELNLSMIRSLAFVQTFPGIVTFSTLSSLSI